ncbi:MAG: potassium/proton antiporter [Polyangiales bacterium]
MTIESAILIAGVLLLLSVLASRISSALGVPSLVLFLALGMLAGSEGIGSIELDSFDLVQRVGTVALLVILFAGGLDTRWAEVKPVLAPGLLLSTVGVLITTALLGTFAWFALGTYTGFDLGAAGLTWLEAFLLAAIVSSTDAAAVFSVFRTSDVQPVPRLRSLLELESGSNDPMAVLLTTLILGVMATGGGVTAGPVTITLLVQFAAGGVAGGLIGWVAAWVVNRVRPAGEGLIPVMVLAWGLIAFGLTDVLGGNSYLAVYLAGMVLGNRLGPRRQPAVEFHDGLSWLMQIGMFVMLGLLVFPSELGSVAAVGVAIALFLMLVARPVSVFLCLLPFSYRPREKVYVSWVGLRGSVPIILATFPASYGIAGANQIFNLVFFIVLVSVLVQGMSLVPVARRLGVTVGGGSE